TSGLESENSNESSATPGGPSAGAVNALNFDGNNDTVTIPNSPTLSFNTTLTVEAWINARTISNLHGEVVSKDDYQSGRREFDLELSDRLQFVVFNNSVSWDYARDGNLPTN